MANAKKVYWDTSVFICYLSDTHPQERVRAAIAEDVLNHAKNGDIEIWTSVWTMAEVIRPHSEFDMGAFPKPGWAALLNAANADGTPKFPNAPAHFEALWRYYKRHTRPSRILAEADAEKIRRMFEWPWVKTIDVVPHVAQQAADICRKHNMKAGDAVHVASAVYRHCEIIHRWDKDFKKTDSLIPSCEPVRMSPQDLLLMG